METERKVYFSAKTYLDWDIYKESTLLQYKRLNILMLITAIAIIIGSVLLFIVKGLSLYLCIILFLFSFTAIGVGCILRKSPEIMHGRQRIRYGKDVIEQSIEFSDKMYISSPCDLDRSYDYALVEKLYETKKNYLLVMAYGVTVFVDKASLKGIDGLEFRNFIFNKCYSIKKPLFKKLRNGQKLFNRLTVAAVLLSIVVLMLYFFQVTPENWRELG